MFMCVNVAKALPYLLLHHRPPTPVTVILFVLSGLSFSFRFVLPCLSILFGSLGTFRGFPYIVSFSFVVMAGRADVHSFDGNFGQSFTITMP